MFTNIDVLAKKRNGGYKVTDWEFEQALRKKGGLFAQTAAYLKDEYNLDNYTRQAVERRAKSAKWQKVLNEIHETNLDAAEGGVIQLFKAKNEGVRLKAIQYYLEKKGKKRGYSEDGQQDININIGGNGIDASKRNK